MSSSSEDDFATTGTYTAFVSVLVLNTLITLGIFVCFGILRSFRNNKYFFAPQYYEQEGTTDTLPNPGTGLFSWISPVIHFKEEAMFSMRGLDAVMYIKFLKYMTVLFLLFAPLGLGLLLPLDVTDDLLEDQNQVPALSLANVHNHNFRVYVHGLYAIFTSFLTMYVLYRLYSKYTALRIQWLRMDVAHNYTVMYTGVPKEELRSTTPIEFFSRYFPNNEIVDAQVGVDADGLRKLVKKWEQNDEKLRFARAALEEHGTRTTSRTKPLIGKKMDSIAFFEQRATELGAQIEAIRNGLLNNSEMSRVGFVTFRTVGQANKNAQLLMDRKSSKLVAYKAPEPTDVYWKELELPRYWRPAARPVAWAILTALIIFWGTLTVAVQGFANLDSLSRSKGFRWLNGVRDWNPVAYGLIAGFLPALALIILFALLPRFLGAIARAKGVYTRSQVQRTVYKYYFMFLLVNVFLVSLLSGGAIQILQNITNDTGFNVLTTLGKALPAQSSFFINYILVYALFSYPMNILRIGPFIVSKIKKLKARSTEECKKAEKPKDFKYDLVLGIQSVIFIMSFAYAPIAPFILPWSIFFFFACYLYGKYLHMYVHCPEYDSGALYWPAVFNRLVAGMIIGQITLIGLFIFKTTPALIFVVPLPFITLGYAFIVHHRFDRPSSFLAMNDYPVNAQRGEIYRDLYKDPVLTLNTHAIMQQDHRNLNNPDFNKRNGDLESGNGNFHRTGYGSI